MNTFKQITYPFASPGAASNFHTTTPELKAAIRRRLEKRYGRDPKPAQFIRWANNHLAAIQTGEFREPRKGELYLSGAIIEAYFAPNDLTTPYFIAKLVYVEEALTQHVYDLETNEPIELR